MMKSICLKCKGRGFCGRSRCAVYTKTMAFNKVKDLSKDFHGTAPSVFVGHYNYPNVFAGLLSSPDKEKFNDSPREWSLKDLNIQEIADYRSQLINSRSKTNVKNSEKIIDVCKEAGMAKNPVDVEINLKDKPKFKLNLDPFSAPTGPNADLVKAEITSNPNIDTKVYRVVDDDDLKSNDAIQYLFKKGYEESFLSKLLSIGNLGIKKERKLVPTRWSITAVDDNLGKRLIEKIKDYSTADYLFFTGSHLGNYYLILVFPEVWSYELFEIYAPKASWNQSDEFDYTTDHEFYSGRKNYAENCAGGYYAARLPILEKLEKMKRQGSILVIRVITGDYSLPLGVWVCREASRKTITNKPLEFGSKELMLKYLRLFITKKFGFDIQKIIDKSQIIKEMKNQSKLSGFFDL